MPLSLVTEHPLESIILTAKSDKFKYMKGNSKLYGICPLVNWETQVQFVTLSSHTYTLKGDCPVTPLITIFVGIDLTYDYKYNR